MSRTSSPLRYPGGKSFLAPYFEEILAINSIKDGEYIEPFAGGAGAAFSLLFRESVSRVVLNDASYSVYSFWKSIRDFPERFIEKIQSVPITLDYRYRCADILNNPNAHNMEEVGFATFFLNRVNRGGIITGGPIGGYHQEGLWKLNARFNRNNLCERVEKISRYRDRIHLSNRDAITFLSSTNLTSKTFVYLDPPYFGAGRRLYLDYYTKTDHERLAKWLKRHKHVNWILTYDDVPAMADLYEPFVSSEIRLQYSAHKHSIGSERMFFSPKLKRDEYEPGPGESISRRIVY